MAKKNKIIIAVVAMFFIVAIAITIFFNGDKKKTVDIYKVQEQNPITFSGSAQADSGQDIYLDSTKGEVVDYYVKNDEEVVIGQSLFIYENKAVKDSVKDLQRNYNNLYGSYKDAQSQVDKAKGQLSKANSKINDLTNKINSLPTVEIDPNIGASSGNIASLQMELEAAKAEAQAAEVAIPQAEQGAKELKSQYEEINAKIASAKENINYIEKAKVGGIVKLNKDAANASIGMTGGEPIVAITSKEIIIKGKISEYDYEKISLQDRVDIEIVNSGKRIGGTITYIDSLPIDNSQLALGQQQSGGSVSNYSFDVKPDEPIHYGFSVNIKLPQEDIFIPEEAVEKSSGKFYVYTVEKGKTVKKEIKVQLEDGIYKLDSGLEVGDEIIANIEGITEGIEVETNAPAEGKNEATDIIDEVSTKTDTTGETIESTQEISNPEN